LNRDRWSFLNCIGHVLTLRIKISQNSKACRKTWKKVIPQNLVTQADSCHWYWLIQSRLYGHLLSWFYYGHTPVGTVRINKHCVKCKEACTLIDEVNKSPNIIDWGEVLTAFCQWPWSKIKMKLMNCTISMHQRENLTSGHRTTIKKSTIRSKAIERNVIMCLGTKMIIKIMQYWILSSANSSILPMHYGSDRCCTTIIYTTLWD